MFTPYRKGDHWSESLHIFLYAEIVLNKKDSSLVAIEHYKNFELTDKHVAQYNEWVVSDLRDAAAIEEWMTAHAEDVALFSGGYGADFVPKVVLWSDRAKTDYFKEKLQISLGFENYIENMVREKYGLELGPYLTPEGQYDEGENELGIEIKNDTLIKKTGNIYFEYAEKSNAGNDNYVDSGILKNDKSTYFLIGDKDGFWIFRKSRIVEIYREEIAKTKKGEYSNRGIRFVRIKTSMGMLFPVKSAQQEAISMDKMIEEIQAAGKGQ